MRLGLEPTDNCSTPSNSSLERKMPLTTLLEDIIPSEKKSSTCASTESENLLTSAQDSKVSSFSTPLAVELDQDSVPSSLKDSQSTTERNPSLVSPSTHHLKSQPQLLNHTTPSYQHTHSLNTLMSVSCLIMKPSMISAEET